MKISGLLGKDMLVYSLIIFNIGFSSITYLPVEKTITVNCENASCLTKIEFYPDDYPFCGKEISFTVRCLRSWGSGVWKDASLNSVIVSGADSTNCSSSTPCKAYATLTGTRTFRVTCDYSDPLCNTTSKNFTVQCFEQPETKLYITDVSCNVPCIPKYRITKVYSCEGTEYPMLDAINCLNISPSVSTVTCDITVINRYNETKDVTLKFKMTTESTVSFSASPCANTRTLSATVNMPFGHFTNGEISLYHDGKLVYVVPVHFTYENKSISVDLSKLTVHNTPEYPYYTLPLIIFIIVLYLVRADERPNKH